MVVFTELEARSDSATYTVALGRDPRRHAIVDDFRNSQASMTNNEVMRRLEMPVHRGRTLHTDRSGYNNRALWFSICNEPGPRCRHEAPPLGAQLTGLIDVVRHAANLLVVLLARLIIGPISLFGYNFLRFRS